MIKTHLVNYLHSLLNTLLSIVLLRVAVNQGSYMVMALGIWQAAFSALSFGVGAFSGSLSRSLNLEYAKAEKRTQKFESLVVSGLVLYTMYAFIFAPLLVLSFFRDMSPKILLLFVCYSVIMYGVSVLKSSFQAQRIHHKYLYTEIVIFSLIITTLFFINNKGQEIFLYITISGALTFLVLCLLSLRYFQRVNYYDVLQQIKILFKASPIYFIVGALTTLIWADILFLSKVASESVLATFIIVYKLPDLGSLFLNKFSVIQTQKWIRDEVSGNLAKVKDEMTIISAIILCLGIPFYWLYKQVVSFLFNYEVTDEIVLPVTIIFVGLTILRVNTQVLFVLARLNALNSFLILVIVVKFLIAYFFSNEILHLMWSLAVLYMVTAFGSNILLRREIS